MESNSKSCIVQHCWLRYLRSNKFACYMTQ